MIMARIFLNGQQVGTTDNAKKLARSLITKRRSGVLPINMNISYHIDRETLQINTDGGRVQRPLIVVEKGVSLLTKQHLLDINEGKSTWAKLAEKGIIEYLDAEEEENTYIALKEEDITSEHTHLELDPLFVIGAEASLLVYPEKDRGDRLNYGSRMIVQSTGIYLQNYLLRDDTTSQILSYPQVPMVASDTVDATKLSTHPAGQNLVIALMPYYGYNIEDAIIINQSSLDRGLGKSTFFRTYVTEVRRYWGGQEDEVCKPEPEVRGYRSEEAYSELEADGIVPVESVAAGGSVIVGKTSPLRFLGLQKEVRMGIKNRRENSLTTNRGESGIVEKVIITDTKDGNTLIKVSIREPKIPEIGDKFASRHGQKGVVGLIVPEEDMPFTADGVTPDVIINPHAIPSRMTVGQLLEFVAGKTGALTGTTINGTAFHGDEKEIRKQLAKEGFRDDGKEVFYNGITGEKIDAHILVGIGYYQRLYHMVSHKIHARSRGPIALLTKQPTEGRSKEGGLRFGEMEKDCLIAHGAAVTLKERFGADKTVVSICKECGIPAVVDYQKNKSQCPLCKGSKTVDVEMSYAFKLLLDEMRSMMIYPQI
ncbi:MAG: DNA-directed RNA polymerase subunit B, partial [Candidatus Aenigmarchaeota archaeon]|nr:DNA-directed RNA polymerase subunit B [Candidatus Aenigmarchaeota archaeon]